MHYKIKELHKLITYLVNEEGISDYAEKMLEGYAFSLETVIKENCNIQPVVRSDLEDLKDCGYEEDDHIEEDETLFGIENNFPPSNMTEKEWNKGRE